MKSKLLLFLPLLIAQLSFGQIVNIPDANFKNALLNHWPEIVDTNGDGEIQVTEAEAVTFLDIEFNSISDMTGIESFVNLIHLDAYSNPFTSIDLSQNTNLGILEIGACGINSIDLSNNINIESLYLTFTNITTLDLSNNTNISVLVLRGNNITNVDFLSNNINLEILSLDNNNITNVDLSNNPNLKFLYGGFNSLSSINLDGATSLEFLELYFNNLTTLDLSNNHNLQGLDLNNNNLHTLDLSNQFYLTGFDVEYNDLTYINIKNGVTNSFTAFGNPNLSYVCTSDDKINYIQYILNQANITNCNVNSYCSFTPGGRFYEIIGNVNLDIDSNGICDLNDVNYPYLKLNVSDGNTQWDFYSSNLGQYYIPVRNGNYTLTPQLENPSYFNITPATSSVDFPATPSPHTQDYCVTPNGIHNDVEIVIVPLELARPGFATNYKLIYKNKGNTTMSGTIDFTFNDDVMDFVTATPSVSSQTTGSLSWSYSNLLPFETREIDLTMLLNTPTDPNFPLNGGDILNYTATINPVTGDETPADNVMTLNQTVVNSYDPNDIRCLEGESITPSQVGEYVHYLIRFENTGTASAVNVVVKDVIDTSKLDIDTLIPLHASHNFTTRIKNTNEVEFIFENIILPFDDANNDGYVLFKIKILPTLVLGDSFDNTVEIYFDFNFPIITNTYTTTVENSLSANNFDTINFTLYPNPTKNTINIKGKTPIDQVSIMDINGRVLQNLKGNADKEVQLNVSNLSQGIYFVEIVSGNQKQVQKLIKN